MLKIKQIQVPGYQKVLEATDPRHGLHSFVAIHDTSLGPALGGLRIYPYSTPQDALNDALRLSKAMTYKSALAENGLGGGKSVIIADPQFGKTNELLLSFAEVIDGLKGEYIVAEDVGTNTDDMVVIKSRTPYVCALPTDLSSGDPSRFTAWGVYRGILAASKQIWGTHNLKRRRIAILGLGNVGSKLANILFWEGAELILSDIDANRLHAFSVLYGAEAVDPLHIAGIDCDVFSPSALGGIINSETVTQLKCAVVAGCANNQLQTSDMGKILMERGILYAPDYVINAGGIINAAIEFDPDGYNPKRARDKVNHIYDTLTMIFKHSDDESKSTDHIANEIAEHNLAHGIGKRQHPLRFSSNFITHK